MIIDKTNGRLDEMKAFAKEINEDSLQQCLNSLETMDVNSDTDTHLFTDYHPQSFYFVRYRKNGDIWMNGGIIFHGEHDNGGDGGAPTFSMNLTPQKGWRIHT